MSAKHWRSLGELGLLGMCATRAIFSKCAEARIEQLAFFDNLTGLSNRRMLLDRLGQVLAQCTRQGCQAALLFLDLDNFKDTNETLGHEWGDRLLVAVARPGGDGFAVVLQGLSAPVQGAAQEVEVVALKILAGLNQSYEIEGQSIHSTPSIGIALSGARSGFPQELLKQTGLAMYEAKAQGRNTLCFFDPRMQATAPARSLPEADLRQALMQAEFLVHCQRVVEADGGVIGAEALRWQHPQRGLVLPGEFIGSAEQAGLIMPLGRWAAGFCAVPASNWRAGLPKMSVRTGRYRSMCDSISKSFVPGRKAAGSAVARQGEATTAWMIWKWNECAGIPAPRACGAGPCRCGGRRRSSCAAQV